MVAPREAGTNVMRVPVSPRGPGSGGVVAVERLLADVWAGLPGAHAVLRLLALRDAVQRAAAGDPRLQ